MAAVHVPVDAGTKPMLLESNPGKHAIEELRAGSKQGHWVWWIFPTLGERGGDANSARQNADLASVEEAAAYVAHPRLRAGLLEALEAAATAFERHATQAPWRVLDAGFGRAADGKWIAGPVDAFKLRCCATLFAVLAAREKDTQLRAACLRVLATFKGDCVYAAGGPGTAGYVDSLAARRNVLAGPDESTLEMLGVDDWTVLVDATRDAQHFTS
ncbi:hypothetical protein CTAYLR_002418 [Chrysophaeum taylorii]|uniref:Uncharacterized protein n=1 Tax=Chrysophaeum taylorii TaxID=2483200 RepID=A0AAD7UMK5_9STRA|nr:hypothetical protein CTAYLR_002418 [Chrysophaeum taylorii]